MTDTPRPVVTAFEWVPEFARGLVRDCLRRKGYGVDHETS